VTAVVALGAVTLAWVALRSGEPPVDVILNPPADTPAEPVRVAAADALAESPAVIRLRELRAMSETYRNTTFVIAIREAGYVCHQLLDVHGGVDDAMAWTADCSDMLAYTVRIASAGTLAVEPLATYFDGLVPQVDQQFPEPRQQLQQQAPVPRR
jgi:hypothetical protein